jgi:hypothetical protein
MDATVGFITRPAGVPGAGASSTTRNPTGGIVSAQSSTTDYPYTIPLVSLPSDDKLAKADPSRVLEFFRIEAVLRSPRTHAFFSKSTGQQSLLRNYLFDWSVLKGSHHELLWRDEDSNGPYYPMMPIALAGSDGVQDLKDSYRNIKNMDDSSGFYGNEMLTELQGQVSNKKDDEWLYLKIDTTCSWKGIEARIHLLYKDQRKKTGMITTPTILMKRCDSMYQIPYVPRHSPAIRSPKAWLTYLKCYDLRHCTNLSFGEIAKTLFPYPTGRSQQARSKRQTAYDEAERGYKKVARLIKAAEAGQWPPKSV